VIRPLHGREKRVIAVPIPRERSRAPADPSTV
jgi:hypothetical protein